ncbi:hypothetical protein ACFL56_02925 [Candidatus Margulisiibacteriota bacterium]
MSYKIIYYKPKRGRGHKLTIEEMQQLAEIRGGKCLSKEYINAKTKLKWQCSEGHQFEMRPSNVKQGQWCPKCAKVARLTIEKIYKLAEDRGGKFLSEKYEGSLIKHKWQCAEDHIFEMRPSYIKQGGWCPQCRGKSIGRGNKLTIEEMHQLAEIRGGKCLSIEYINANTKLKWQCAEGHEFEMRPGNVKQGQWCPKCNTRGLKKLTIEEMHQLAEIRGGKCLSIEYINANTKLKWQCAEGHEFEMRPGNVKQGQWCLKCNTRGLKKLTIEEMHQLAKSKGGKCLSKEYINAHTKLKWQCQEEHKFMMEPRAVKMGHWCPECGKKKHTGRKKLTIEEMYQLAESRDGKFLSEEYLGSYTKHKWQCKDGHEFKMTPAYVKKGGWCPQCRGKSIGRENKLTIEKMHQLAEAQGGKCLSEKYINSKTKLKWQCAEGHEFEMTPAYTKRGGWCPQCRRKKRKLHYA